MGCKQTSTNGETGRGSVRDCAWSIGGVFVHARESSFLSSLSPSVPFLSVEGDGQPVVLKHTGMAQSSSENDFHSWTAEKQDQLMTQIGDYMRQEYAEYDVSAFAVRFASPFLHTAFIASLCTFCCYSPIACSCVH